ncbi:MAG TPA: ATP-binding protein [Spirochaetota bacterium]|nr:ATP-binding protein [Spirochaetota bacterium]
MALCLLVWTACAGCGPLSSKEKRPVAVKGVIDLRDWDFERDGAINLNGEWEFCWDRELAPADFTRPENTRGCSYITVPGLWEKQNLNGNPLPGEGRATYRLKILRGPDNRAKTMTIHRIYSAYRLFVNGVPAGGRGSMSGSPPEKREDFIYIHNTYKASFPLRPGVNEIVLQVVNRDHDCGGIDRALTLNDRDADARTVCILHAIDMMIIGLALFTAIYNMLLYGFRRSDRTSLLVGLISLAGAVNTFNIHYPILTGPLYFTPNPFLLNFISAVSFSVLFFMIFKSLFPDDFSTPALRLYQVVAAGVIASLFFVGFRTSERIVSAFYILTLAYLLYQTVMLAKIMLYRRKDAVLFFIGFIAVNGTFVNNLLYALQIIDTGNIMQYAMVVFCVSTTAVISRRFARAIETVEEMSRELTEKNIALEKTDRLKDQFLAATSHELRTPLHGMIGLSNSLLDGAAGGLSERARDIIALIAASGNRLANMVNDLLDMAKIQDEGFSLDLRPVDLQALSAVVMRLALPLLGERPVEIVNRITPDLPCAWADEDRVRQVLSNLVGNAIKFTNKGSIELSALIVQTPEAASEDDTRAMIEVRVTDTGIGVPEEYRESIFEAYLQVDGSDTRSYGGTGLGLAIAKRIVEAHGGAIWMTPGERGGSVFAFTLPIARAAVLRSPGRSDIETIHADPSPDSEATSADACDAALDGSPVILAVDDDPVNLTVLRSILEPRGCVVKTAATGISALDLIERDDSIRLVLLDIMMPIMSGFEACRRIRAIRSTEELPVIMLTAKNMMADIDAAFAAGANDYIVKPFQPAELIARVGVMLALRKVRRATAESLTLRVRGTAYTLSFGDIVYVTAHSKDIVIHTTNDDIVLPLSMKEIADRLPPDMFIRIHRSHIINLRNLRSVSHVVSGRYRVRLADNDATELPVGAAYLESLRKRM